MLVEDTYSLVDVKSGIVTHPRENVFCRNRYMFLGKKWHDKEHEMVVRPQDFQMRTTKQNQKFTPPCQLRWKASLPLAACRLIASTQTEIPEQLKLVTVLRKGHLSFRINRNGTIL